MLAECFFSASNILHEIFLWIGLQKGIHYKSNYNGSVKESLKKCINFYLLKSFRLTFIQYMNVVVTTLDFRSDLYT